MTMYAELHCLSNFSFLRGASHPGELVREAHRLGYSALALTDECSMAGIVRAWEASKETGLPLVIGAEFVIPRSMATRDLVPNAIRRCARDDTLDLVLLAQDHDGFIHVPFGFRQGAFAVHQRLVGQLAEFVHGRRGNRAHSVLESLESGVLTTQAQKPKIFTAEKEESAEKPIS